MSKEPVQAVTLPLPYDTWESLQLTLEPKSRIKCILKMDGWILDVGHLDDLFPFNGNSFNSSNIIIRLMLFLLYVSLHFEYTVQKSQLKPNLKSLFLVLDFAKRVFNIPNIINMYCTTLSRFST